MSHRKWKSLKDILITAKLSGWKIQKRKRMVGVAQAINTFNDRLPFTFRLTWCVAVCIVELFIGQVIPFMAQIQLSFIQ